MPPVRSRRSAFFCGLALGMVAGFCQAVGLAPAIRDGRTVVETDLCPVVGDKGVTDALLPLRRAHGVPAIAAAIVTSEGITAIGAVGVRKAGTDIAVTLDDKWHLGSDTKAMTATLVAGLVETNKLRWGATLAELLPEQAPAMHPDKRDVTLKHLLSHRAGLPANLMWGKISQSGTVIEQRRRVLEKLVGEKPLSKPGETYAYSNAGYVLVGAILEQRLGRSWEELIRERVFGPLGMDTVGFGGTGTPGRTDQPRGHTARGVPVNRNGPEVDNPPVMGPAGRAHCTIRDWAKFVVDQLRGAQGKPALLSPASYKVLHTPPFGGEYALGWIVVERGWGGGTVLNHGGCNTMNHANVWMAPKKDFAVLICINQGDETAFRASDECAGALVRMQQKMAQSSVASDR